MNTWLWVVVALLIGALLGGLVVYLLARRRWADAVRSAELQRQLDEYRQEVGDHFVETAELVNNLTRSYKAVYDHLEQGAYRLVDEETLRKQLGDVDAEAVRLEYIGRRNKAAVLGSGAAAEASRPEGTDPPGRREESSEWAAAEEGTAGADARAGYGAPDDIRNREGSTADHSAWTALSTSGSASGAGIDEVEEESVESEASGSSSDEPGEQEKAARSDGPWQ